MQKTILSRAERVAKVTERDGPDCFLCKQPFTSSTDLTLDHWIPQSKGGTWDLSNLRLAHLKCNSLKGDTMPDSETTFTLPNRVNSFRTREIKRSERPDLCQRCENGRSLAEDEYCNLCGSLPMPLTYPRWAKMKPSECSHEFPFWCWMEALEPGLRKPAIADVLDSEGYN